MFIHAAQGLWRGKRCLSMRRTFRPASARIFAAVEPAGPAPTTITSRSGIVLLLSSENAAKGALYPPSLRGQPPRPQSPPPRKMTLKGVRPLLGSFFEDRLFAALPKSAAATIPIHNKNKTG
jgi:hypothetical protein